VSLLALLLTASLASAPLPEPPEAPGAVVTVQGSEFQIEVLGFGHPVAAARSADYSVTPEEAPPELRTEAAGRLLPGAIPPRGVAAPALLVAALGTVAPAPRAPVAAAVPGGARRPDSRCVLEALWRPG
jgi:hypothetical protein